MNQEVEKYLENLDKWKKELTALRQIIVNCGLTEDFKWMHPCYLDRNKNILLIHEFKDYCAILFNKGALLNDSQKILVKQTENTQAARQIRFTSISEIIKLETVIKEYIYEAIEVERAGLTIKKKSTSDYEIPAELRQKFEDNTDFENAFNNLTEGRKRGYLLHFSQPKQSKTRMSRIENSAKRIFLGKGLNDCICGLSKRKPNCDGSHKTLEK
jgi:uncharacterized protein YdeI (YjbR/CyaY-like superfamily)